MTHVIDTESLLTKNQTELKLERKRRNRQNKKKSDLLERSKNHLRGDSLAPGVTPGSAASKMLYGARLPLAPVMTDDQYQANNPESVAVTPDMDRDKATALAQLAIGASDLPHISDHFSSRWQFEEHSKTTLTAVRHDVADRTREQVSSLGLDPTAHAPGETRSSQLKGVSESLAKAMGVPTQYEQRAEEATKEVLEEKARRLPANRKRNQECKRRRELRLKQVEARTARGEKPLFSVKDDSKINDPSNLPLEEEYDEWKKRQNSKKSSVNSKSNGLLIELEVPDGYADDPALFGGAIETRNQLATMNHRGRRKMTEAEVGTWVDKNRKTLKPKRKGDRHADWHEAPPISDANLVAFKKGLLKKRPAFDQEALDALDNTKQDGRISSSKLPVLKAPAASARSSQPISVIMAGMEIPAISVLPNDRSDRNSEFQDSFVNAGDRMANEGAEKHRYPTKLPVRGVDNTTLGALEDAMHPDSPALCNMTEEAEIRGLPSMAIDGHATRQPMIHLTRRTCAKANDMGEMGFAEQLVFDQTRTLGNLANTIERWAIDPLTGKSKTNDRHLRSLTSDVKKEAQRLKLHREVVGRRAQFEQPHLVVILGNKFAEYCLSQLVEHDVFFKNDRVHFAEGTAFYNGTELPAGHPDATNVDRGDDGDDEEEMIAEDMDERILQRALSSPVIMPYRRKAISNPSTVQRLLEASRYGLLGNLTTRIHTQRIEIDPTRVGTDHLVSAFDLATSRLSPSCNPQTIKVGLAYHMARAEECNAKIKWHRRCLKGDECYCNTAPTHLADNGTYYTLNRTMRFICREFLLPDEESTARVYGELPTERRLCIICYIAEINQRVVTLESKLITPKVAVNNHSVEVNVPGGYKKTDCLHFFYMRHGKQIPTGVSGFFPIFCPAQLQHCERREGDRTVRYITYSPSMVGFR